MTRRSRAGSPRPRPRSTGWRRNQAPMTRWSKRTRGSNGLTVDELDALERLFREAGAETVGDMPEADQAKAAAIYYSAESRRLSGAPKDKRAPEPPW
jgi:hypothetical protein